MGACEPVQGREHRRPGLATSLARSVWVRERCSSFLILCGRPLVEESSVPHVGSTVELDLVAWVWVSCSEGVRVGEPFLPLLAGALGKIARPAQESWSCGMGSGYHYPGPGPGLGVGPPYPIYELLEHMKDPVL